MSSQQRGQRPRQGSQGFQRRQAPPWARAAEQHTITTTAWAPPVSLEVGKTRLAELNALIRERQAVVQNSGARQRDRRAAYEEIQVLTAERSRLRPWIVETEAQERAGRVTARRAAYQQLNGDEPLDLGDAESVARAAYRLLRGLVRDGRVTLDEREQQLMRAVRHAILVTLVDPAGPAEASAPAPVSEVPALLNPLAHPELLPSLRQWLEGWPIARDLTDAAAAEWASGTASRWLIVQRFRERCAAATSTVAGALDDLEVVNRIGAELLLSPAGADLPPLGHGVAAWCEHWKVLSAALEPQIAALAADRSVMGAPVGHLRDRLRVINRMLPDLAGAAQVYPRPDPRIVSLPLDVHAPTAKEASPSERLRGEIRRRRRQLAGIQSRVARGQLSAVAGDTAIDGVTDELLRLWDDLAALQGEELR